MIREITACAASIEEAIKKGAEELGVSVDMVQNEVLTEPKRGFLGFGAVDAKVRVLIGKNQKQFWFFAFLVVINKTWLRKYSNKFDISLGMH